jgi:uncharacterized protein YbaP (TraB family)
MLFKTRFPNIHLYGSIHLWDNSSVLLSDEAAEAYRVAKRVIFEVDFRLPFDSHLATYQDGRRLSQALPQDLVLKLRAAERKFGLSNDGMENFKPWAAALFCILPHQFRRAGFSNGPGVDVRFFTQAVADGKCIDSFETLSGQLAFFDNAPALEQETFLRRAISLAAVREAASLFKAYRTGDIQALEAIAEESMQLMPTLFSTLIHQRNINWKQTILEKFNDGVPTIIVVGVLHCVGPTAVQNL